MITYGFVKNKYKSNIRKEIHFYSIFSNNILIVIYHLFFLVIFFVGSLLAVVVVVIHTEL